MRRIEQEIALLRHPIIATVLIAVSVGIGVAVGIQAAGHLRMFVYALVLMNVMIMAYLMVLKDVVNTVILYLYSLTFLNYYWRIVLPGRWPDLDLPRLIFAFVCTIFLLEIALKVRTLLPRTMIDLAMASLALVIVISMATGGKVYIRQFLNGYAIPYATFVISRNIFSSEQSINKLIKYFVLPLSAYFPLNQIFEHYGIRRLVFPPYILDTETLSRFSVFVGSGRAMGAFLEPSATVFAMVACYFLTLWVISKSKAIAAKAYGVLLTILVPVGVFFSYTRSAYAAFVASMLVVTIFSSRLRLFGMVVLVATGLAVLANWENVKSEKREVGGLAIEHTVQSRLVVYQAALKMMADHPINGVGFERFMENVGPYLGEIRRTILGYRPARVGRQLRIHNHFLSAAVELGFLGLVPLLLIYYLLVRGMVGAMGVNCPIYDRDFVVVALAILINWITVAFFIETRFYEFLNVFPLILAGIVIGGKQRVELGWFNSIEKGERK